MSIDMKKISDIDLSCDLHFFSGTAEKINGKFDVYFDIVIFAPSKEVAEQYVDAHIVQEFENRLFDEIVRNAPKSEKKRALNKLSNNRMNIAQIFKNHFNGDYKYEKIYDLTQLIKLSPPWAYAIPYGVYCGNSSCESILYKKQEALKFKEKITYLDGQKIKLIEIINGLFVSKMIKIEFENGVNLITNLESINTQNIKTNEF